MQKVFSLNCVTATTPTALWTADKDYVLEAVSVTLATAGIGTLSLDPTTTYLTFRSGNQMRENGIFHYTLATNSTTSISGLSVPILLNQVLYCSNSVSSSILVTIYVRDTAEIDTI